MTAKFQHCNRDFAPEAKPTLNCNTPGEKVLRSTFGILRGVQVNEGTGRAIEQITPKQLECLLLVQHHLTSKEIASRLGISPHTVDQRIRLALRTLGCKTRFQAAQLLSATHSPARLFQWPAAFGEPYVEQARPRPKGHGRPIPPPFATSADPTNEMSPAHRLLWIVVIACGAAFSMGVYLAGLESFARLLQGS